MKGVVRMKKLICLEDLEALVASGSTECCVDACTIITPAARDFAKSKGICFCEHTCCKQECSSKKELPTDLSKADVLAMLKALLASDNEPVLFTCDKHPSGLKSIKGDSVQMDFFDTGTPGANVHFQELVNKEESKMSAGFLEIDRSAFDWNVTYEEIDYVIEGTLEVTIDGKKYSANAGDVLFVPKDSKVVWSSPNKARVFYVTYPANWADLL